MNDRRSGNSRLTGKPLDDNGAIEFSVPAQPEVKRVGRTVEDGFGSAWPPCQKHGCSMQVMRPGDATCPECEDDRFYEKYAEKALGLNYTDAEHREQVDRVANELREMYEFGNRPGDASKRIAELESELERVKHERDAPKQHTNCSVCGDDKPTPFRRDELDGYVCIACIDKVLTETQSDRDNYESQLSTMREALEKCKSSFAGYAIQKNSDAVEVMQRFWEHISKCDKIIDEALASLNGKGE